MEFFARWTIRLAVALLVVVWARMFSGRSFWARGWKAAALFNLIHVVLAMWYFHRGSHTAAAIHVASETQRVFGVTSSVGIYVNYVFTVWWLIDAFVLQRDIKAASPLSVLYRCCAHGVVAFMVFNGTVVFGQWWWTPVAAIVGGVFLAAWVVGRKKSSVDGHRL